MNGFFQAAVLRIKCLWWALCGRRLGLYANIVRGLPTAYRVSIRGTISGGDESVVAECHVETGAKAGISVGAKSFVYGCVVTGVGGYGIDCCSEAGPRNGAADLSSVELRRRHAAGDFRQ